MPNWSDLLAEVKAAGSPHDIIRRRYLQKLHETTGRNVIVYYSGWLQKSDLAGTEALAVNDNDKNAFMATIHQLDRSLGLDLLLHTPGGDAAATESLIDYLRAMFGANIRAIVPQLAMSAGTIIALACNEVMMGKHSSLGPIDPQFGGLAAHGILEEFERARQEIAADQMSIPIWQPILAKYHPTLVGDCEKAIKWSKEVVRESLTTGMFSGDPDADEKAVAIVEALSDHALTMSHARHISADTARGLGINVVALEDDSDLQDGVLTVHHACIQTLTETPAVKIVENHNGVAYISAVHQLLLAAPSLPH